MEQYRAAWQPLTAVARAGAFGAKSPVPCVGLKPDSGPGEVFTKQTSRLTHPSRRYRIRDILADGA
jgi:hypothetical protein